jgi:hypothetical protein
MASAWVFAPLPPGLATAGVLRGGLERCKQRSLLVVYHADGLLFAEDVEGVVVVEVDDTHGLRLQCAQSFPRLPELLRCLGKHGVGRLDLVSG